MHNRAGIFEGPRTRHDLDILHLYGYSHAMDAADLSFDRWRQSKWLGDDTKGIRQGNDRRAAGRRNVTTRNK